MFDAITIGTATLDVYLMAKYGRRVKDKYGQALCLGLGGKHEVEDMYLTTGGGATNAAVTFSRQGFRTATVAKIGNDIPGALIENDLVREKIVPFLICDKKARTAYSTLLLSPSGERTILVYRGASENLKAADIPWRKLKSRWIYFASGGIDFLLLKKLVSFFSRQGAMIAINPGKAQLALGLRRLKPILRKTKVFIVNREEAARLSGVSYRDEKKIFDVLDRAVGGVLVVTDGERGVKVSDGMARWKAGVFKERKVIDRTGAGDSFGSGFVAGLMQKRERCEKGICKPANIAYAIRLATANATSNIESIGPKSGILNRSDFQAPRWQKLAIRKI